MAKTIAEALKNLQERQNNKAVHGVYKMKEQEKKHRTKVDFDELFDKYAPKGYESEETIETLKKYFNAFPNVGKGLLVYGSLGVGKTLFFDIIHNMAKDLAVTHGYQDMYFSKCTAPWLVSERMESVNQGYAGTFDISTYYRGRLYIDDLGAENLCFNKYELLEDILFQRHRNEALTMISTNLSPEEIGKRYGARIFDRLGEMFYIIKWQGKSKRKYKK